MKPIVLLDCDGVLADFTSAMLGVVRDVVGKTFTSEDVAEFDFCKALGLDSLQASRVKKFIGNSSSFCANIDAFAGAKDGVARLSEIADIYIVTSPWNSNPWWTHDREAWLKYHFDIHHSNVIHTSAKHLVRGDFLIDDKTETVERWQEANPAGVAVQWQTPHNRRDACAARTTRSWDELYRWVAS